MDRFLMRSAAAVLALLLAASPCSADPQIAPCTVRRSGQSEGDSFRINECKNITDHPEYNVMRALCREHAVTTFHESTATWYSSTDNIETFSMAVHRLKTFKCLLKERDEDLCHPQLRQYICRMIFPRCFDLSPCILDEWWPGLGVPCLKIFPCRELCESVRGSCASCFQGSLGGSWPVWAECRDPDPRNNIFFHNKEEAGRCEPLRAAGNENDTLPSEVPSSGRRLRIKDRSDRRRCGKCLHHMG